MRSLGLVMILIATSVNLARAADQAPATTTTDVQGGGGSLSDKLSATGGVITPKSDVDPAIKVTPPATGTAMPVIPPPGSPGGDPDVKPK